MKSLVKEIIRRTGYDIIQYARTPKRPPDILKFAVDARLSAGMPVRFVQVGANDGIRNDPIRHLVVAYNLPGILVEPVPDLFEKLTANYLGHRGIICEQCAISDVDGQATLYRVRPTPGHPEWAQGLASFERTHLSSRKFKIPNLEECIEPLAVSTLTIRSLLEKHNWNEIDLLQVDTEGFDCRIVTWAIQAGLRPAMINYEFIHVSAKERAACKQLLANCGYKFVDVGDDTLALLDSE